MKKTKKDECLPSRKWHAWKQVERVRLPKGDDRGDYHVKEKCKHCGHVNEYDCIYA